MVGTHDCIFTLAELLLALFYCPPSAPQVRPVNDEEQLARLDTLPTAQMRPEFK